MIVLIYFTFHKLYNIQLYWHIISEKILSINKGSFIPGGVQVFGKFKTLKACMKACGASPNCFGGDYDPWLGKCYFHSNITACDSLSSHTKITHFKKIPCSKFDLVQIAIH